MLLLSFLNSFLYYVTILFLFTPQRYSAVGYCAIK
nr:MAG TPA: hypothetical protein [Caudoviricetes sp.]